MKSTSDLTYLRESQSFWQRTAERYGGTNPPAAVIGAEMVDHFETRIDAHLTH